MDPITGFPAWFYCKDGRAQIVADPDALAALGPDWADSPAAWTRPEAPAAPAPEPVVEVPVEVPVRKKPGPKPLDS